MAILACSSPLRPRTPSRSYPYAIRTEDGTGRSRTPRAQAKIGKVLGVGHQQISTDLRNLQEVAKCANEQLSSGLPIDKDAKESRNRRIFDLWLACWMQQFYTHEPRFWASTATLAPSPQRIKYRP